MQALSDLAEIKRIWRWPNFKPEEFRCKGDGTYLIVPEFMDKLQALRTRAAFPFRITSGYRSPAYNAKVAETGSKGPHTTGRAVDISVFGLDAFNLVRLAMEGGFTGIGISQKGTSRFVHLDDLNRADGYPRPAIWTY